MEPEEVSDGPFMEVEVCRLASSALYLRFENPLCVKVE
jgi:hypothetical protein